MTVYTHAIKMRGCVLARARVRVRLAYFRTHVGTQVLRVTMPPDTTGLEAEDAPQAPWETTRIERTLDKTAWGLGPWEDEPDLVAWRYKGVPCLILRTPHTGSLCGYAAVTPRHRYYRCNWDHPNIECHGGLTYSGEISEADGAPPGELWWFGFDTSHAYDYMPAMMGSSLPRARGLEIAGIAGDRDVYRTLAYVRGEVESIARRLSEFPLRRRPKLRIQKKHLARLRSAARQDLVRMAGRAPGMALDIIALPLAARCIVRAVSKYPVKLPRVPKSLRVHFQKELRNS